jgi:hypothetical protein
MASILEAGHIYFFYRPRVETERAEALEDVERFYLILRPHDKQVWRLLILGRKRLPEAKNSKEKVWAFVAKVGHKPEEIEDELDRNWYGTKTRGERVQPEARPAGEGVYSLVAHDKHTHLTYKLEFPKRPGKVQEDLRIEPEGSYIITVRNPDAPAPPATGLQPQQRAEFPKELKDKFKGRRFISLEPDFLDYEGAELVLVGATTRPEEELGIELKPEEESETEAAIFSDLKLERDQHPLEPLFKGEWR